MIFLICVSYSFYMAFTVQKCLHIFYLVFLNLVFLLNFRPEDGLNRSKYIVKKIKIIVGYLFCLIVVPQCSYRTINKHIYISKFVFKLYYLKGLNK